MEQFESAFELYRQMAANVPDCSIYVFDHDFDYLLAEGEEITKLGGGNENLIGCNFFEVWPQEVTMTLSPYYLDTLKGKRQKLEQETESGYFIQHFIPIYNQEEEVIAGMVVSQNITLLNSVRKELSARDEELKEKQRLFEGIVNTVGEGIVATDLKGEVVLSNPAADKLLGLKLRGKSLAEIKDKVIIRDSSNTQEIKDKELPASMALKGAKVDGYTLQLEDRETHEPMYVESSARPLVDANEKISGSVLVMRDVSSRKELEDLLEENLAALKQKNARLEHFMTKLSYNLLGPTANLNILYALLEKCKDASEREAYISRIGEVARVLQQSVGNISTAMMTYTSSNEEWGINSFAEAIDYYLDLRKKEIESKSINLTCDFVKRKEMVYPYQHFREVITSLLDNILQFCQPNEEIHLTSFVTGKSVGLEIKAAGLKSNKDWQVISKSDVGNLADSSGLTKAKSLVQSLGGMLSADGPKVHVVF